MNIYLDHAATTKPDSEILDLYIETSFKYWGNSSATHLIGQKARAVLEKSRLSCANLLGVKSQEIYFTGTATEANNIAIQGVILESLKHNMKPHILISPLEHGAVSDFVNHPNSDLQVYPTRPNGVCDIQDILPLIRDETVLICLMLVSNEIGTIQPVKDLTNAIKEINVQRKENKLPQIWIHSDCVQAPLYISLNFRDLGVDMAVISGHKLYAPRGAAMLYIRGSVKIQKSIYGGGQEKGLRSGTENLPVIVCFTKALQRANLNRTTDSSNIRKIRDYLVSFIVTELPNVHINGDMIQRIPNNLHITIPGVSEDSIVMALDLRGFAVSSGSSCTSGAQKKSNMSDILSLGLIGAGLRITLGKCNTIQEIELFCIALKDCIKQLSSGVTK
jgi:cysteine desulfurase